MLHIPLDWIDIHPLGGWNVPIGFIGWDSIHICYIWNKLGESTYKGAEEVWYNWTLLGSGAAKCACAEKATVLTHRVSAGISGKPISMFTSQLQKHSYIRGSIITSKQTGQTHSESKSCNACKTSQKLGMLRMCHTYCCKILKLSLKATTEDQSLLPYLRFCWHVLWSRHLQIIIKEN